jgi:hypothetical protein
VWGILWDFGNQTRRTAVKSSNQALQKQMLTISENQLQGVFI